jgi:hypothetical protein
MFEAPNYSSAKPTMENHNDRERGVRDLARATKGLKVAVARAPQKDESYAMELK